MVSWKVALVVVIVAALMLAIGMWFGYRYGSEQDDISPEGRYQPSRTAEPHFNEPLGCAVIYANVSQEERSFFINII